MQQYGNISGVSDVAAYDIAPTYIDVKFHNSARIYRYPYTPAGESHVETMKQLAAQGYGLNAYINKVVRYRYEK